ncbi:hypothetical protein ABT301_29200 [Streptomyces sp. NPDC000987]|uniref:hypothetical protein n=1 Tax=Streptomyces sp. NPDC000987 TaxID=3154374 RepID=UPI003326C20E
MTTTTQAPGPDGETAQLTAGLTADHAPAHTLPEPEPEPEPPVEPEPVVDPEPDDEPEPGERPAKPRALAMPDLRPYADPKAVAGVARQGIAATRKPAAGVARRAAAGTRILASLLYGWMNGSYGAKLSIPARIGGVVLALLATVHTVAGHPAPAALGLTCVWLVAAVATGSGKLDRLLGKARPERPETVAKGQDAAPVRRRQGLARLLRRTPEKAPAEDAVQAPADAPGEPPLTALIRELIGDDNGVHLSVLRPAMRERLPGLAEADDKQLREVLVKAGFDPSRTFRARGVAGRSGVHRDELPPPPSPRSGQEAESSDSPPPESGIDLRKSPPESGAESAPERGRRALRKLPEGWTEEDDARGWRAKRDRDRSETAWLIERREDVE